MDAIKDKQTKDVETEACNTFNNDNELIDLKDSLCEKYRGYGLVAGGAFLGFIVAGSVVRSLEFQPATLIEDEKIISLGFTGICMQFIGCLIGAAGGAMLEWKNLSDSITSKLKEKWNLKETIKNKVAAWESTDKKPNISESWVERSWVSD